MKIAKLDNNQIVEIGEHTELFPNISFPVAGIPTDFMLENSLVEVISWEDFDRATENLTTVEPYVKDGKVYTCLKVSKTEQEIQEYATSQRLAAEKQVRLQRNQLLKDSDWTQITDTPTDKEAWVLYRQALRDITAQEGFPFNITWPDVPAN